VDKCEFLETSVLCPGCGTKLALSSNGDVSGCSCGAASFNLYGAASKKRRNKYGNIHTKVDGKTFDSLAEANYYAYVMRPLAESGEIVDLIVHPKFVLQKPFTDSAGVSWPAVTYESDFQYERDGRLIVVDVKGVKTAKFKIQELLFRKKFPRIEFIVTSS